MSGKEAGKVKVELQDQPLEKEGEELSQENAREEEIYQASSSSSASSSSGDSSKDLQLKDDHSSQHEIQSPQPEESGYVSEASAPPSTPVCISKMETDLPISASIERTQSSPTAPVEPPPDERDGGPQHTNLQSDTGSVRPRPPPNVPPHATTPPFIRNIYASELRPSPPPGIGALLKLHPPPHLAHDFLHRPTGSLLSPSAGSPSRNASVAPTSPGGNLTPRSSNLPPLSTLPSPAAAAGGNQLRSNLGPSSSSSSSSHQQFQLPQLNLSTNPQVSMPFGNGIVMPPPGFSGPSRAPHELQFQGLMGQPVGPSNFSSPRGRGGGHFQQLPNSSFHQGIGSLSYNDIGSSSISLQTSNRWPVEVQGNFMNGRQLEAGESSSRPSKVQVLSWPDMIQPSPNLQLSSWNNNPTHAPASQRSRYIRNSLYDPSYEAMGLPVDPHLRLFLARRNGGNGRA